MCDLEVKEVITEKTVEKDDAIEMAMFEFDKTAEGQALCEKWLKDDTLESYTEYDKAEKEFLRKKGLI